MQASGSAAGMKAATRALAAGSLRRACRGTGLAILAGTLAGLALRSEAAPSLFGRPRSFRLTDGFFREQDAVWLFAMAALLLAFGVDRPLPGWKAPVIRRTALAAAALAAVAFSAAAAGAVLVLRGFALSRDEVMASFDAAILASGRLVAALPPEWRSLRRALVPDFLLPVPGDAAWVSGYLPGNAALRAAIGLVAEPALAGPILAAVAVVSVYGVARRLWPARPDAALVAALLLASSPQVLVTAMTSYAMNAHLAFNLVWLWLFLRGGRLGHAGAIAVGFLACGLHQVVFHPLFAAPFVAHLWAAGRRPLALAYALAYAVIGSFWTFYWSVVLQAAGIPPDAASVTGAPYLIGRVAALLVDFTGDGAVLMLKNGLRFVAWQPLLLLPLPRAGWPAVRGGDGIARPLAAGIGLTLAAMFLLLPYQGHGWGYRYLHGLIGSLALLAAQGWIAATPPHRPGDRLAAGSLLGLATAFTLAVLLPVHVVQAARMIAPYRAADAAIRAMPADIVLVDKSGLLFAGDLVRNDPFLTNRPKVLDLTYVPDDRLADLCRRYRVSIFDRRQATALGIGEDAGLPPDEEAVRALRRALATGLGCGG